MDELRNYLVFYDAIMNTNNNTIIRDYRITIYLLLAIIIILLGTTLYLLTSKNTNNKINNQSYNYTKPYEMIQYYPRIQKPREYPRLENNYSMQKINYQSIPRIEEIY